MDIGPWVPVINTIAIAVVTAVFAKLHLNNADDIKTATQVVNQSIVALEQKHDALAAIVAAPDAKPAALPPLTKGTSSWSAPSRSY